MVRKRIRLAQNFFRDPALVAGIVADSSIAATDVVYEIGPGSGIITAELARAAGKVVAVEKDLVLAERLRRKFRNIKNVEIVSGDFLGYRIRDIGYKAFSNIPFNITAEVVKRILFGENPPREAYLIVQREAAEKFSGSPRETEVSVLAKPWFELNVLREFRRTDFEPAPAVDVVLLSIARRERPLVRSEDAGKYRKFIKFGFGAWREDLKTAYRRVFTFEQWRRLSENLHFSFRATPTELTFEQWLGLFEYFLAGVTDSKKAEVLSK